MNEVLWFKVFVRHERDDQEHLIATFIDIDDAKLFIGILDPCWNARIESE